MLVSAWYDTIYTKKIGTITKYQKLGRMKNNK